MFSLIAGGSWMLGWAGAAEDAKRPDPSVRQVPWTSSRIAGTPDPPPPYRARQVFGSLRFHQPVDMTAAPGSDRLFVAELEGRIYSFRPTDEPPRGELFFDLRREVDRAEQVYGLTFHPDFQTNRYCYLCYVLSSGLPDGTRVSRFTVTNTDPPAIDPRSERTIITWLSGGHNGGCLKFGPDGFLYISTGDATGPFPPDVLDTGQDVSDLLSSILRIDVDRADEDRAYTIPPDNPLVEHSGARGEIWSYGFRNPWKMSFDPPTGDLWVGDVGWELWELIFRVERGGNYGWSVVEGRQPVQPAGRRGPTPILPPTIDHPHTESRSITGGFVYRGRRLPELEGAYVYGDYETGKIWGLKYDGDTVTWRQELADTSLKVITFAVDADGELYIVDYAGTIHVLDRNTRDDRAAAFPRLLSQTGLLASVPDHQPASGVYPYGIRVEKWSDGATSTRMLAVPGDGQVDTGGATWAFPPDTVLAKTISLPQASPDERPRKMETQILHLYEGEWRAYTYVWNDEQTDAVLADAAGIEKPYTVDDSQSPTGQIQRTWHVASRAECLLCHNTFAGTVLACNGSQLDESSAGGSLLNVGLLRGIPDHQSVLPRLADEQVKIDARGRAYLHANCAHCHRNGGGGTATLELDYQRPLAKTGTLLKRPTQGDFGIDDAQIIAPGDPHRSVFYYRMATLGRGRMPHLGSTMVDHEGLALIRRWIERMPTGEERPLAAAVTDELHQDDVRLLRKTPSDEVGSPEAHAAIARLLSSTSGALALTDALQLGLIEPVVCQEIIEASSGDVPPAVRGLMERFVPEHLRTRRLGAVVDASRILALVGDRDAGERLFFQTSGVQCVSCHRMGQQGTDVGPDLSHVGRQLNKAQLLESLLEPSKKIEPKYVAFLVETTSGVVHTGLLAGRTGQEVVLKDGQGKLVHVPAAEVEQLAPLRTSLMPELLLRDLTEQQVADLLEYLASLK